MKRPSIMALSPSLLHYFWKSMPDLAAPDLQGVFTPASYSEGYVGMLDDFPGMTTGIWQHRPDSRGQVRICSADPLRDPLILANYLEDERDQQTLVRGIRLARQLLRSQALAPYFDGEVLPGPLCESDAELLDFARRYGVSSYHVNGTARMGQADDRYAVVDPQPGTWHRQAAHRRFVGDAVHALGQHLRGLHDDRQQGRRSYQAVLNCPSPLCQGNPEGDNMQYGLFPKRSRSCCWPRRSPAPTAPRWPTTSRSA